MKCNFRKFFVCLGILVVLFSNAAYAHSGRTDSNGGHKDNQNKSGLGSYHYHCGGYPAHLHSNGICPYSSSSLSSSENTSQSTTNNSNNNNSNLSSDSANGSESIPSSSDIIISEPTTIDAENIEINEDIEELNIGEIKQLTINILPIDTTDKKVTWESSDESIITVNEEGQITTKKAGNAEITVSTSNGKTDSIKIYVKEEMEEDNNTAINTLSNKGENVNNIIQNNNSDNSSPIAGLISLGAIGGGGYWLYKKYKK